MKTPRVTDFDPDAKIPELKSSLEGMPVIGKPKPLPHSPTPEGAKTESLAKNTGTVVPVPGYRSTVVSTGKRLIKRRHPFDVYEDQLKLLKTLALEEKQQGLIGSESAMIREAIDDYLQKRKSAK